jgi:ribosomal protein S27E
MNQIAKVIGRILAILVDRGVIERKDAVWILEPLKETEQEPKTGHWKVVSDGYGDNAYICECSECKDTVWVYKDADRKWNYCPNCGAKMTESEE